MADPAVEYATLAPRDIGHAGIEVRAGTARAGRFAAGVGKARYGWALPVAAAQAAALFGLVRVAYLANATGPTGFRFRIEAGIGVTGHARPLPHAALALAFSLGLVAYAILAKTAGPRRGVAGIGYTARANTNEDPALGLAIGASLVRNTSRVICPEATGAFARIGIACGVRPNPFAVLVVALAFRPVVGTGSVLVSWRQATGTCWPSLYIEYERGIPGIVSDLADKHEGVGRQAVRACIDFAEVCGRCPNRRERRPKSCKRLRDTAVSDVINLSHPVAGVGPIVINLRPLRAEPYRNALDLNWLGPRRMDSREAVCLAAGIGHCVELRSAGDRFAAPKL